MKVLIIEDELLSAEHLSVLLQKLNPQLEVIGFYDSVKASVAVLQSGIEADLIFMDIHLADGNSFEIFNQIQLEIPVIFTTAFDHYAIPAFKKNSVDYLLKPIAIQDLDFALKKFEKQQKIISPTLLNSLSLVLQEKNKTYKSRFLVKLGQTIDSIPTHEVHHFHTKESLTFLVTNKGNQFVIDYSLDDLESILEPKEFFRINRKIIIHYNSIEKINPYFNSRLAISTQFIETDSKIVSRERVNDFKKWLDN